MCSPCQVYRLIRLDPRVHDGQSLVHLACSPETSTVGRFVICHFPNTAVLNLLFQLGANPNCMDVHGQRPLLSVLSSRRFLLAEQASLVHLLVQNGAHLDAVNKNGLTALAPQFVSVLSKSGLSILEHTTLACQASRVARRAGLHPRNIPPSIQLPGNLWSFIQMH
ncbi:Ankyrin repeat protein [Paragonimus westermani]|uniref:Ankyrin repeat protein n=1 Tax=Paragonimus westermani TaxID=34504 RepID=A0A8T0DUE4_9TREM|nr:Ankyrin repeat protein [Paragonimus westermani]